MSNDEARSNEDTEAPPTLGEGTVIDGRYRIGRVLGSGGMGTVFRAEHLGTGAEVALKILRPERLAGPQHRRRFEMEARNAAVLQHINTVRVFDYGLDDQFDPPLPYLAMELVNGQAVTDIIEREGPMPWRRVVRIASQVLKSLWEAHEHPRHIVHRDIKPSNILVCDLPGETDFVKVVDFGVARALALPDTDSEQVAGSPPTMAPECWQGGAIGPPTDLYSLGCTVYEMLCGQPAFRGDKLGDWARQHLSALPPPVAARARAGTPGDLIDWVNGLLRKLAHHRPASARAALLQLEVIERAEGSPVLAAASDETVEGVEGHETVVEIPVRSEVLVGSVEAASSPDVQITNLTPAYTHFVGRRDEWDVLSRLRADGARLITLHGPGGTGKTRLCREWGRNQVDSLAGGVWFADLTEATTLEGVVSAVSRALGVALTEGDPQAQLAASLANRGPTLLILDNVEQVLQPIRPILKSWLNQASDIVFVVTSRARLGLAGERVVRLSPLPIPDTGVGSTPGQLLDNDAIALFVERAQAVQPAFTLTEDNAGDVVELVRRLDGLPLAIELAAARVRVLSPRRLRERLEQGLELVRTGDRDTTHRQATLAATIEWSWRLLQPHERHALSQCAIFRGGFGLDAAESVIDLADWPAAPSIIDVLESLCDQSLLVVSYPARDEPRFSMLVSVQAFAWQRLAEPDAINGSTERAPSGDEVARRTAARHSAHYGRLGGRAFRDRLGKDPSALAMLERELANLWAAWTHGLSDDTAREHGVGAFRAIQELARRRGPLGLALETGPPLADCPDLDPGRRAQLHVEVATIANLAGRLDQAARSLGAADQLLRQSGPDPALQAGIDVERGLLCYFEGRLDEARRFTEGAMTAAAALGEPRTELRAATALAAAARLQGDEQRAIELLSRALDLSRRLGDRVDEARCHANLGAVLLELDRAGEARSHLGYADELARDLGDRRTMRWARMNWGVMCRYLGQIDNARQALEEALAVAERDGDVRLSIFCRVNRSMVDLDQGRHVAVRDRLRHDLVQARLSRQPRLEGMMLLQVARLELELGETGAARQTTQGFYALMERLGDPLMQLAARLLMARISEAEGALETAEAFLADALAVAQAHSATRGEGEVLAFLARVLVRRARLGKARSAADRAVELLRPINATYELGIALAHRALVARAAGSASDALAALDEARAIARAFGAVAPSALAEAVGWAERPA